MVDNISNNGKPNPIAPNIGDSPNVPPEPNQNKVGAGVLNDTLMKTDQPVDPAAYNQLWSSVQRGHVFAMAYNSPEMLPRPAMTDSEIQKLPEPKKLTPEEQKTQAAAAKLKMQLEANHYKDTEAQNRAKALQGPDPLATHDEMMQMLQKERRIQEAIAAITRPLNPE